MLEAVPPINHQELSPLEKKRQQWTGDLLNDVFGKDQQDQSFEPKQVDRSHLEMMAREIFIDLDDEGLFSGNPNYDEVEDVLEELRSELPDAFKIKGSSDLLATADLHRTDIVGWVNSTFGAAEKAGFTGPKQLIIEEE